MQMLLHPLCSVGRCFHLPGEMGSDGEPHFFFAVSQRQIAFVKPPQPSSSQLRAQDGSECGRGICLLGNVEIIKCE